MIQQKLHTVTEVARSLGLTTGRIRQICNEHGIGEIYGSTRLFSEKEVKQLCNIPDRRTKNRKIGKN